MENAAGIKFILKYGFFILIAVIIFFLVNGSEKIEMAISPESCNFDSGFNCIGFSAHKDGINIILQNLHDFNIAVKEINFKDCSFSERTTMASGITRSFHLTDCVLEGKLKDNIIINYSFPDEISRQINGSMVVIVK